MKKPDTKQSRVEKIFYWSLLAVIIIVAYFAITDKSPSKCTNVTENVAEKCASRSRD